MSPELQRIQRADRLMLVIWRNAGLHVESEKLCTACREVKRSGLADKDGHFICYDCYNVVCPEHARAPKHCPQGDDLYEVASLAAFL